ncbi:MAG: carboxypeptidase-like regulatory domain-containing protein [Chitinophagaceae bacterium]
MRKPAGVFNCLLVILLLVLINPLYSYAGDEETDPMLPYDEILVFMNVQGVGSVQIPAAIRYESAYLSVTDVFDFLKIRNTPTQELDSITGFFINPQAPYIIDRVHNRIEYQGKKIDLPAEAIIRNAASLYMRTDIFGQVFGLQCRFNFRSLSVILSTDLELPVIREMRQEAMRNNLGKLKGETVADTVIKRKYPLFRIGAADWALTNTQDVLQKTSDARANLTLGAVVAGGETNVSLNYHKDMPLNERDQFYQWRYVNNNNGGLRQITLGKVYTASTASIFAPVVGVQFTNAPSVYRRSFGSYTLSYYVEAGWIAELYVNNTLIDYAKATITGVAYFQVPLVYGSSQVKIKFYSPWGEERSSEQNIQVPFNFLPGKEFQYSVAAGVVEDSLRSRFGRVVANYGLTNHFTIGAGLEYLSSVTSGSSMPFVSASLRLSNNLLFSADYAYGVRTKLVGNYHNAANLQIELNYTRYKQGQTAINNTFLEERKAIVSYPWRRKKFTLFTKLTAYQIVLPEFKTGGTLKYSNLEWVISTMIGGVSTNFNTYAAYTGQSSDPYLYSAVSMALRLPGKILFTPQVQYDYNKFAITSVRGELGKYIGSRGYLNMFYENNYKSAIKTIGVGLRYDLSFALTGLSFARGNQGRGNNVQSASGSLLYDDVHRQVIASNRTGAGKGALSVVAFLDINGNGKHDKDEPAVNGIVASINGGRIRYDKAGNNIVVTDLEAYAPYILRVSESFENISWHIKNKTIGVTASPNQFTLVEIPVTVMNEVTGTVYLQDGLKQKGLSRIIIDFYAEDLTQVGQAVTEPDGTFSFSGLPPGNYRAMINEAQLQKLNMAASPVSHSFSFTASKDGGFADGINFILQHTASSVATNK